MQLLGTFILWFGCYGFNCGSTLSLHDRATGQLAAHVAMNTTLSGSVGGITAFTLRWILQKRYDVGGMCNGILAGLVSITAGCSNVECGSAVFIGFVGAVLMQFSSSTLQRLHIDDPVDAFGVHGVCGAWGTLAAALFDWGDGFNHFHGWNGFKCFVDDSGDCMNDAWILGMRANLAQVISTCLYTAALSFLVMVPMRVLGVLRSSDEVQEHGADSMKHSPRKAYYGYAPEFDAQQNSVTAGFAT